MKNLTILGQSKKLGAYVSSKRVAKKRLDGLFVVAVAFLMLLSVQTAFATSGCNLTKNSTDMATASYSIVKKLGGVVPVADMKAIWFSHQVRGCQSLVGVDDATLGTMVQTYMSKLRNMGGLSADTIQRAGGSFLELLRDLGGGGPYDIAAQISTSPVNFFRNGDRSPCVARTQSDTMTGRSKFRSLQLKEGIWFRPFRQRFHNLFVEYFVIRVHLAMHSLKSLSVERSPLRQFRQTLRCCRYRL